MNKISLISLLFLTLIIFSCKEEDDDDNDNNGSKNNNIAVSIDHENTYADNETGYRFYIGDELFEGQADIINNLDRSKAFSLSFWYNTDFDFGAVNWLPKSEGIYDTGYNLGEGNSSFGEDLYMNGFLKYNSEKYYAFSSDPYAHQLDKRVENTLLKIKITRLDGDYKAYTFMGGTLTSFIGNIKGVFAGELINKTGDKIVVTKGEFSVYKELPMGAELVE